MAKDAEISRIENKVKLSLLQAEKRLVELEVAVTELKELKEKFQDFDFSSIEMLKGLPEMKQQMEDLQDLTAVENLGVEELKKVMEDLKTRLQNQQTVKGEDVLNNLQPQIAATEEKIKSVQTDVALIKSDTVKNAELSALKQSIEKFVSEKVNTEMKISELDKKVNLSMDNVSGGLSKIDAEIQKLEWLKSNTDLTSPGGDLETIRQAEANVSRMVTKSEALYDTIAKKNESMSSFPEKLKSAVERVSSLEKELSKAKMEIEAKPNASAISQESEELKRRTDEFRIMLQDRVRREDVLKLLDSTNRRLEELERKQMQTGEKDFDVHSILKREFEPVLSAVSTQISTLLDRLVTIETKISMLEKNQSVMQPIILE